MKVRRATHRLTGQDVAIKTLRRKQYEQARMPYPPREVAVLETLNHPNVNRLLEKVLARLPESEDVCGHVTAIRLFLRIEFTLFLNSLKAASFVRLLRNILSLKRRAASSGGSF